MLILRFFHLSLNVRANTTCKCKVSILFLDRANKPNSTPIEKLDK